MHLGQKSIYSFGSFSLNCFYQCFYCISCNQNEMQSKYGLSFTRRKGHEQLLWRVTALSSAKTKRSQAASADERELSYCSTDSHVQQGGRCLPVLAKFLEFPGEINPFSQHEVSKVKHVIIKAEDLFFFAKMALKYLQDVKRTQRSVSTCFRSQDPGGQNLVHEPEALPAGSCLFPITSSLALVLSWYHVFQMTAQDCSLTFFFLSFLQTHFHSLSKSILTSQVQNQLNCRTEFFYMFDYQFYIKKYTFYM